jgi:hypothetical protein
MNSYQRAIKGAVARAAGPLVGAAIIAVLAAGAYAQTLSPNFVSGAPGTSVWFDVSLDPQGTSIAATQNPIFFDRYRTPISTCVINSELGKSLSFALLPVGCFVGGVGGPPCTTVRALVFTLTGPQWAITSPRVLYRCRVDIPANAPPGFYPLYPLGISSDLPAGSTPPGDPQPITGLNGGVTVCSGPC